MDLKSNSKPGSTFQSSNSRDSQRNEKVDDTPTAYYSSSKNSSASEKFKKMGPGSLKSGSNGHLIVPKT